MKIERHIISAQATIREAASRLNALPAEHMTLFVVDGNRRLVGSLTDGDIRRAIIAGKSPDGSVYEAMHRSFMAARETAGLAALISDARTKGVRILPELDAEGCIVRLIDVETARPELPLTAVLMAGGRGERLRPLTLTTPKPLLPVGGKAIIDYNVDALASCGVKDIYVTVNYLHHLIEEHFAAGERSSVKCVAETKRLGTLGSLSLIPKPETANILVMNSDLLTDLDFAAMLRHHTDSRAALTVAAITYTVAVPYAIMHTEGDRVTALSEKPTYNYSVNAGVYIMRSELLGRIKPDTYLDAPDFIESLIAGGDKVSCFPIEGQWIDIGSPEDYRRADTLMRGKNK